MKTRRHFFTNLLGISAAAFLPATLFGNTPKTTHDLITVKPKKLKKGDTIGLVAPGYAIKPEVLEKAISTLEEMGFIPFHTNRILGNHGYFSNTDEERANGGKIDRFERIISIDGGAPEALAGKLAEIAGKCPVHRTLEHGAKVVTKVR